ncbi:MAG TPA: 50S ribosomal protein L20 [Candidatus Saccharimonadales bacterium]|nr:50S ribosomal protein L20 [Candidatus Saccharimonadales bacterium]
MRVKRGKVSKRKHNKLLESVKGYRGSRSRLVRTAKAASLHSGPYAFHGRKLRKRDFRTLWITRISEAIKDHDMSYSVFIYKLKNANIMLDRKIISDLVVNDPQTFKKLVGTVQSN